MAYKHIRKGQISAILISFCIGLLIFLFGIAYIRSERDRGVEKERLEASKQFFMLKDEITSFFDVNFNLLYGYIAYLRTNPDISEEEAARYLDNLTAREKNYIKSVATLKDTTIVRIYPLKGNESALGRDLSKITGQSEKVLKVKETGKPVFQGPVALVQGGIGYIARIPIIDRQNNYWGQVSIVIDGTKLEEEIKSLGTEHGVNVAFFEEKKYPNEPFIGDKGIMDKNPVVVDIKLQDTVWKGAFVPKEGWEEKTSKVKLWLSIYFLFSTIVGFLIYYNITARYDMKLLSLTDQLTGLYNRRFMDEYYKLIFERAKRNKNLIGFIMLDINDFKSINDTYGHKAGDRALILTAESLRDSCRSTEAVFRMGGDEFLVLAPDLKSEEGLQVIASRIRNNVTRMVEIGGEKINIVPSIGTALYPQEGEDFDLVLNLADERMYEDKKRLKAGKNKEI